MNEINVSVRRIGSQESEEYGLSADARIIDLIERTEFNIETVVVKLKGIIVPEEENLEDGDKLEIIPIISGG